MLVSSWLPNDAGTEQINCKDKMESEEMNNVDFFFFKSKSSDKENLLSDLQNHLQIRRGTQLLQSPI